MNAAELTQYLTEFCNLAKDAKRRFEAATEEEARPNEATQDILHTAELDPSALNGVDVVALLHKLREERRIAKKELEVTEKFYNWATSNAKALNLLDQTLGEMRKVLRRQPSDMYRYKTDCIAEKDSFIFHKEPKAEEEYHQITIFELMEV